MSWPDYSELPDGTLLYGPYLSKKPQDARYVVEIEYNGVVYCVRCSGAALTDIQRKRIHDYTLNRLMKVVK
jgi:hypothetical protein